MKFVHGNAKELIDKFNYSSVFMTHKESDDYSSPFIQEWNKAALKKSMQLQAQEEIYSIYVNYPALLLRQKSRTNPLGRTSIRFKEALRRKVTIIDKNLNRIDQNEIKNIDRTDVDDAEQEVQEIQQLTENFEGLVGEPKS